MTDDRETLADVVSDILDALHFEPSTRDGEHDTVADILRAALNARNPEPTPEPDDREALADALTDLAATHGDATGTLVPIDAARDVIIAAGFRRHPEPVNPTCEHGIALSDLCEFAVARAEAEFAAWESSRHPEPSAEDVARAIADAQNVPFVGPKQRRIATAVLVLFKKEN